VCVCVCVCVCARAKGGGGHPRGKTQLRCEADHSPPSNVEVKKEQSSASITPYIIMVWCLITVRDNFIHCSFLILFQSMHGNPSSAVRNCLFNKFALLYYQFLKHGLSTLNDNVRM
jgi:hypothetical protein